MPKMAVALALLALIGSAATAPAADVGKLVNKTQGIIIHSIGRQHVTVVQVVSRTPGVFIRPSAQRHVAFAPRTDVDARKVTIFNNFTSYAKSPYWGWLGIAVAGPDAGLGIELWQAVPFTPATNQTATEIDVAAISISGTNGLVLSINNDAGGVPGAAIHTGNLMNLPQRVPCCAVVGIKDRAGIPLTGGQRYWIVLSTNAQETDTEAAWALTELAKVQKHGTESAAYCSGPCASHGYQNGWNIVDDTYGLAFTVLGGT